MNDGKTKEILDKFENNMEQLPAHFIKELQEAIELNDSLGSKLQLFEKKNMALALAFDNLMELHQELREKIGFDRNTDEMKYDLYQDAGVLELEE